MRFRSLVRFELLMLCLTVFVLANPSSWKAEAKNASGTGESIAQDYSFSLTRVPENPARYSLVISGADENTISGIFSVEQLQILRAMMNEAEKFALSNDSVGTKEPIITRFEDKQEGAFVVDVEKAGNQSRLFLTVKSEIGRMTAEAGKVVRSSRREEGFFFDLLSRLESVLPKPGK